MLRIKFDEKFAKEGNTFGDITDTDGTKYDATEI